MFRSTRVFDRLGTGVPPAGTKVLMGKAVVLGGSMAGLLAARVLADHAESVVILERDEFGAVSAARPGVPHGNQVHVLLPGGRVQLDRFYPGFTAQACAEGALLNEPEQQRVYQDGFEKPRGGPYRLLSGSRGLLEALVRRRTLELPNVKAVTCRAHDLVIRDGAATGVWCADSAGNWLEEADFVVDAMGRSSRLSEWLERSGWERPPMRRMKIDVNYATALFRRVPGVPEIGTSIAWRQPTGDPREVPVAATGAIEGNRWIVCVAGFGAYKPGRDPAEFRALCGELPPCFADAASGEMLGVIETYTQTDSRRRDFTAMRRIPARLVAVGDAVASFNPVYGQGMSSAALHASALSEYLRSDPDLSAPARRFFAVQKVVVDAAWLMSTSADLARPDVDGPYPRGYRVSSWLRGRSVVASSRDEEMAARFSSVTFMRRHPRLLTSPGTLVRAYRVNHRR